LDPSGHKVSGAAFPLDDLIAIRLDDLKNRSGAEQVKKAVVRWALGCVEHALRDGTQPGRALKFSLEDHELENG
jgi:hypothetical protein